MGQLTELDYGVQTNNKNQIEQKNNCDFSDGEELVPMEPLSILKEKVYKNLSSIVSVFQTTQYKKNVQLLETLAFYKICYTFSVDMKWKPTLHSKFTINQFLDDLDLLRNTRKLCQTFLRRLAQRGILIERVEGWEYEVLELLPSEETILKELNICEKEFLEFPEYKQDVASINYFGSYLHSILIGRENGLKVLFPNEKDTLSYPYAAKCLYENSQLMKQTKILPTNTGINEHIKYLQNNKVGPIRILEIGAGTGGTTIPLLKSLPPEIFENNLLEYTFTDISSFFVGQTKSNMWTNFSEEIMKCIEFTTLDIEMDPTAQGFKEGTYDIILAADVFHATEFIEDTLDHARKLLKSGGLLVLGEVIESTMLLEISFGVTNGWWRWSDEARVHSSPLLQPNEWNHLLKHHGFVDSFSFADNAYGVIFAQANSK